MCEFSHGKILLGFSLMLWFVSLANESGEGEELREETKEEQELGVVRSWMEVGDLSALTEKEVQGLLREVYPFYLVWFSLSSYSISVLFVFLSLIFVMYPFFSGFGSITKSKCTEGGGTVSRDWGVGQHEAAVAGLEAEGLYGLLRGAISHSHMSSAPPPPKNATTLQLPPSPNHSLRSLKLYLKLPLLWFKKLKWHWKSPPQLHHKLWRCYPCLHDTPLPTVGGIKRVYKCQVEGCSKGQSTSWATICAHVCRDHLGVRLACPSCARTFLNLDALMHHKKITVISNFNSEILFSFKLPLQLLLHFLNKCWRSLHVSFCA